MPGLVDVLGRQKSHFLFAAGGADEPRDFVVMRSSATISDPSTNVTIGQLSHADSPCNASGIT